jgi:nickel/cobalt exporter
VPSELWVLSGAAISVAFVHTLSGPDHYLPFVAMARAGEWTRRRTLWVTALCGFGHVASSVLLAIVGILAFRGADRLLDLESFRADLAAWGLIVFGLLYATWGLRRARRCARHVHRHGHADGLVHEHVHHHEGGHLHGHGAGRPGLWALFIIFVLGPCEPLIPMLMYASAEAGNAAATVVAGVFALVTVLTMLAVVLIGLTGLSRLRIPNLERYEHAIAGSAIVACGLAIQFLGL